MEQMNLTVKTIYNWFFSCINVALMDMPADSTKNKHSVFRWLIPSPYWASKSGDRENDPESMLIFFSCSHGDNRCAHQYGKFYATEYYNILCRINVQPATCKSFQSLLASLSAVIYIYRTAGLGLWCGFKLHIFSQILTKIKMGSWC